MAFVFHCSSSVGGDGEVCAGLRTTGALGSRDKMEYCIRTFTVILIENASSLESSSLISQVGEHSINNISQLTSDQTTCPTQALITNYSGNKFDGWRLP